MISSSDWAKVISAIDESYTVIDSEDYSSGANWLLMKLDLDLIGIGSIELIVGLDRAFPDSLPIVQVADSSLQLVYPCAHLNREGTVCYVDHEAALGGKVAMSQLVLLAIKKSADILENVEKRNGSFFLSEYKDHWKQPPNLTSSCVKHYSTKIAFAAAIEDSDELFCRWHPNSKPENAMLSSASGYIADSDTHEKQGISKLEVSASSATPCCFRIVDELPNPYLLTVSKIFEYTDRTFGRNSMRQLLNRNGKNHLFCLGWSDGDSQIFVAYSLQHDYNRKQIPKKPRNLPSYTVRCKEDLKHVKQLRFGLTMFNTERLQWRSVGSNSQSSLSKLSLIGCGSLGSFLFQALPQDGSISYTLSDPETLSYDNTARHLLGANYVGHPKALALEHWARQACPLVDIETQSSKLIQIATEEQWKSAQLHIVAIGNLAEEIAVSRLLSNGILSKPAVFTWIEPHVAAGHAVLLPPSFKSLEEWFSGNDYAFSILKKEESETQGSRIHDFGCRASFTQYGKQDLMIFAAKLARWLITADLSQPTIIRWVNPQFGGSDNSFDDRDGAGLIKYVSL